MKREIKAIKKRLVPFKFNRQQEIENLKNIIEKYPKAAEAYYLLGKMTNEIHYLDEAISLKPDYCDAYYKRSNIRSEYDPFGAYHDLLKSVKYIKKTKEGLDYYLTLIFSDLGRYEKKFGDKLKATVYYTKVIDDLKDKFGDMKDDSEYEFGNPYYGNEEYYLERGKIFLELKEYKKAFEDINTAIKINPRFCEAYYFRAIIKTYTGDLDGAHQDKIIFEKDYVELEDKTYEGTVLKLFKKNYKPLPDYLDDNNYLTWICPRCQSKRLSFYLYGVTNYTNFTNDEKRNIQNGHIIIVKRMIRRSDPLYICRDCGTQLFYKDSGVDFMSDIITLES